jgi:hypothetical protein
VPCQYCDGNAFGTRRSKLNTAGAEFFGFAGCERLRHGIKGRGLEVLDQDWEEAFLSRSALAVS